LRKYLKALSAKYRAGDIFYEEEIAKRIGDGNAIMLDGKIVAAHKSEGLIPGRIEHWLMVSDRIRLDTKDGETPKVEFPWDHAQDDDEPIPPPREKKEEKKGSKKGKSKKETKKTTTKKTTKKAKK